MNKNTLHIVFARTLLVMVSTVTSLAEIDPGLFLDPPAEARPKTWMHAMDSNLSEEGLKKDLKALADVGIGGALIFSVSHIIPDGKVAFNSPEFRSIIVSGAREAQRLGLTIGVHNCDGWTSSGGPWVPVEESMKRVVWSETVVRGGAVDLELAQPRTMHRFYRDIAVIAYPTAPEDLEIFQRKPKWKASSNQDDLPRLIDVALETTVTLHGSQGEGRAWIRLSYDEPFTARSLYIEHKTKNATARLLVSDDGDTFTEVCDLRGHRTGKKTFIFENVLSSLKARHFRVEFGEAVELVQVELDAMERLPAWQGQVSMVSTADSRLRKATLKGANKPVPVDQVRDLTGSTTRHGRLRAQLPEGAWRVFRFGYTTTGAVNSPATDAGRGFECDKLSAAAVDRHFAAYVGKLAEESGALAGKAFRFSEIDSYEVGGQNWTDDFAEQFKAEKGYDVIPFLPLFAGRFVGDEVTMDAVLRDLRAFTCNLMTKNYYQRFTELCHRHGMLSYIENYGFGPVNSLTVGGHADIPMGEFWIDTRPATHYVSPISAAHTYGKPVISAESFTSSLTPNWSVHPFLLKHIGDHVWTQGINEFMFHRYAHQANTHVVPGMTMSQFGSHIDGTQTWWLNAGKAWMKYIQRGSYLLRQGVPVSDVLIFVGEGSPHLVARRQILRPKIPNTYNFDHCDTEVLMHRLRVKEGRLVLPEGTSYQVLALHNSDRMSLRTLARIGELIEAGARIVATRPEGPIGYYEQQHHRAEFDELASRIWSSQGAGRILPPSDWESIFHELHIEPDFFVEGDQSATYMHRTDGEADLYFFHNKELHPRTVTASCRVDDRVPELWYPDTGRTEVLACYTQADGRTAFRMTFEPRGSVFAVFRKSTQGINQITDCEPADAHLTFDPTGTIQLLSSVEGPFTLTRASGQKQQVEVPALPAPIRIQGNWRVTFDGVGLAEPKALDFDHLSDWKDHARDDIRHFSGSAFYRKQFSVPASWFAMNRQILLDLGRVEIAAEIKLNGELLRTLWKPPFRVDVTNQVQPGQNELEVRITNLWANRLIGDERFERTDGYVRRAEKMPDWYVDNEPLPAGPRSTFSTYNFYEQDRELKPSGLLGPVIVLHESLTAVPDV